MAFSVCPDKFPLRVEHDNPVVHNAVRVLQPHGRRDIYAVLLRLLLKHRHCRLVHAGCPLPRAEPLDAAGVVCFRQERQISALRSRSVDPLRAEANISLDRGFFIARDHDSRKFYFFWRIASELFHEYIGYAACSAGKAEHTQIQLGTCRALRSENRFARIRMHPEQGLPLPIQNGADDLHAHAVTKLALITEPIPHATLDTVKSSSESGQ